MSSLSTMEIDVNAALIERFGRFAPHAPILADGFVRAKAEGTEALEAWCNAHGFRDQVEADHWLYARATQNWLAWRNLQREVGAE